MVTENNLVKVFFKVKSSGELYFISNPINKRPGYVRVRIITCIEEGSDWEIREVLNYFNKYKDWKVVDVGKENVDKETALSIIKLEIGLA